MISFSVSYVSDLVKLYTPAQSLSSADLSLSITPVIQLKDRGHRAFSVVSPKLWSELPLQVRFAPLLTVLKS